MRSHFPFLRLLITSVCPTLQIEVSDSVRFQGLTGYLQDVSRDFPFTLTKDLPNCAIRRRALESRNDKYKVT